MKAFVLTLAALLCGAASAQDAGALCRSFCDADAKQCRDGTHPDAWAAADALLHLRGSPSASPDKHEQALSDADGERTAHLQQCGKTRQTCRQECAAPAVAPVAASAASATP